MKIRRATPEDANDLTSIALAAKGYWGYPKRWMERWRDALTVSPDFVRENEVHVAVVDGESVGFYALMGGRRTLELEHLWVAPDHIGTGVDARSSSTP